MKRLIEDKIIEYFKQDGSLPLLILGSRQIGKTYTIQKIANEYFRNNHLYFNFLNKDELFKKLNGVTSPTEIIDIIEFHTKTKITNDFLLIFDEIQEIPSLKTSIKNFVEQDLKIKIVCLGSYLNNTLFNNNYSFPVGKVKFLNMYPMNFHEFLLATKNELLIDIIHKSLSNKQKVDKTNHEKLLNLLYDFLLIGGMPACIYSYINNNNMNDVFNIQKDLFNQYRNDLLKYIDTKSNKTKSLLIYDNIPLFFSKENKKYKLSNLESSLKYLNCSNALKNLMITKIIYKINNLKNISVTLVSKQKENEFKIYFNDAGFVSYSFLMNKTILLENKDIYTNERGSLAENFIFSELKMKTENLFYYSFRGNQNIVDEQIKRNNSNTEYEIDCVLENTNGDVIPIEIKFGIKYSKTSLKKLLKENNLKYGIVFSSKNFNYDKDLKIYTIPLYFVSFLNFNNERMEVL